MLDRCAGTSGFAGERLKHDNTGTIQEQKSIQKITVVRAAAKALVSEPSEEERSKKNGSKAAVPHTLYSHFLGLKRCIKRELRALLPLGPLVTNPTSN